MPSAPLRRFIDVAFCRISSADSQQAGRIAIWVSSIFCLTKPHNLIAKKCAARSSLEKASGAPLALLRQFGLSRKSRLQLVNHKWYDSDPRLPVGIANLLHWVSYQANLPHRAEPVGLLREAWLVAESGPRFNRFHSGRSYFANSFSLPKYSRQIRADFQRLIRTQHVRLILAADWLCRPTRNARPRVEASLERSSVENLYERFFAKSSLVALFKKPAEDKNIAVVNSLELLEEGEGSSCAID